MRFSVVVVFGLFSGQEVAATIAQDPEVPELPTFQTEMDEELFKILRAGAADKIARLPEIHFTPKQKHHDDYSKILGYFGYNTNVCRVHHHINYLPICTMARNYVGDPAPDLQYGIHFRKWNHSSCAEIAAKILDVSGKAYLIQVKFFQPAVVHLDWLTPNKCQHRPGIEYKTVQNGLWNSMAQTILASDTSNKLNTWIRYLVKVASSVRQASFVTVKVVQLFELFESSMVAVTVFDPPRAVLGGFGDSSDEKAVNYVPAESKAANPNSDF